MIRLICLLLLLPLAGCMHRNMIGMETPPQEIERVNREIGNYQGVARTKTGESLWGKSFQISHNLSVWTSLRADSLVMMPNSQIEYIVVQDRRQGLIEGATYGPLIGLGSGAVAGLIVWTLFSGNTCSGCDPPDEWRFLRQAVGWGALSGAVVGTGIGIIIGGVGGSQIRIDFAPVKGIKARAHS